MPTSHQKTIAATRCEQVSQLLQLWLEATNDRSCSKSERMVRVYIRKGLLFTDSVVEGLSFWTCETAVSPLKSFLKEAIYHPIPTTFIVAISQYCTVAK